MSIALDANPPPAPFGGAELNLAGTHPVSFRPSERRRGIRCAPAYKHLTPNGVGPPPGRSSKGKMHRRPVPHFEGKSRPKSVSIVLDLGPPQTVGHVLASSYLESCVVGLSNATSELNSSGLDSGVSHAGSASCV